MIDIIFIFLICIPILALCCGCYAHDAKTHCALRLYGLVAISLTALGFIAFIWEMVIVGSRISEQYQYSYLNEQLRTRWIGLVVMFIFHEIFYAVVLSLLAYSAWLVYEGSFSSPLIDHEEIAYGTLGTAGSTAIPVTPKPEDPFTRTTV